MLLVKSAFEKRKTLTPVSSNDEMRSIKFKLMSYMYELLLVSQSPRRRELLTKAGLLYRSDSVKVSEIIDENVNLTMAISKLARTKAEAYLNSYKGSKTGPILVLSADTVVVLDGQVIGKPSSEADACQILRRLSGRDHEVMTGISLIALDEGLGSWPGSAVAANRTGGGPGPKSNRHEYQGTEISYVKFRDLTDLEIGNYVATGEPMDKAGAYGIQGLGAKLVESYRGSWSNIVGLPMERLEKVLKDHNWQVARVEALN